MVMVKTKNGYKKYKTHIGEGGKKYIIKGKAHRRVYLHTIRDKIKKGHCKSCK